MSKEQFDAFFEQLRDDRSLREQVAVIKDDPDSLQATIATVAQGAGYDVSIEDVAEAGVTMGPQDKLDQDELDRVAGGCSSNCAECCGLNIGSWVGQQ